MFLDLQQLCHLCEVRGLRACFNFTNPLRGSGASAGHFFKTMTSLALLDIYFVLFDAFCHDCVKIGRIYTRPAGAG